MIGGCDCAVIDARSDAAKLLSAEELRKRLEFQKRAKQTLQNPNFTVRLSHHIRSDSFFPSAAVSL
jgi:hypothetical protein